MTSSVSPQGRSPLTTTYAYDSGGDTDGSWQDIGYISGSNPPSVIFVPSPSSGSESLNGWGLISYGPNAAAAQHQHQVTGASSSSVPSSVAVAGLSPSPSPNMDHNSMPGGQFPPTTTSAGTSSYAPGGTFYSTAGQTSPYQDSAGQMNEDMDFVGMDGGYTMTPEIFFPSDADLSSTAFQNEGQRPVSLPRQIIGMDPFYMGDDFQLIPDLRSSGRQTEEPEQPQHTLQQFQQQPGPIQSHFSLPETSSSQFPPSQLQLPPPPPTQTLAGQVNMDQVQIYQPQGSRVNQYAHQSVPRSISARRSPAAVIQEQGYDSPSINLDSPTESSGRSDPPSPPTKRESKSQSPSSLHAVLSGKVVKSKKRGNESGASSRSNSSSNQFLVMTPSSIDASSGKPNQYDSSESRTTHRGRKGPLADKTKANALKVRRQGACFCCASRKVSCDTERPCKHCVKLSTMVPEVVCWRFPDFGVVLFPSFLRDHFRPEKMDQFMKENVSPVTVGQPKKPTMSIDVELSSNENFNAVLRLPATFFTPKTGDVQMHWRLRTENVHQIRGFHQRAAPIMLEMETNVLKDALKKKARDYINKLISEPMFASALTSSEGHTELPGRVLAIVHRFAMESQSPMVKRALSILAAHYVMKKHLHLTSSSTVALQKQQSGTNLVSADVPDMTARVLNRQIKSIIDAMLIADMETLFTNFAKHLKSRVKSDFAPCLAAFLVFCVFMETVEITLDKFVMSCNEIRNSLGQPSEFHRREAIDANLAIENLPFRQFAFQFHQIYQTHEKDPTSKAYNPLMDDAAFEELKSTDDVTYRLVEELRALIREQHSYDELAALTKDPGLLGQSPRPYPQNVSDSYSGRLVATFLLSFTDEAYIFGRRRDNNKIRSRSGSDSSS